MNEQKLRVLMIGAHPDDVDSSCGGLALRLKAAGHEVKFVSATNGGAGHQSMSHEALVRRRADETLAVARYYGLEYQVLPIDDARLEPTLANREAMMRVLRGFAPDVVITHRTNDYHPDHRACGQLVMDCAYLLRVPLFCPDAPAMQTEPVLLSMSDDFSRPVPFRADLCVQIDDVVERKIRGLYCHESQYFEWLPFADHWPDVLAAANRAEAEAAVYARQYRQYADIADTYREGLLAAYGEAGRRVRCAEAYEVNEYGAPLTDAARRALLGL